MREMGLSARRGRRRGDVPRVGLLRLLRVLTYNVRRCLGADGRLAPERIAAVIADGGPLALSRAPSRFGVDLPMFAAVPPHLPAWRTRAERFDELVERVARNASASVIAIGRHLDKDRQVALAFPSFLCQGDAPFQSLSKFEGIKRMNAGRPTSHVIGLFGLDLADHMETQLWQFGSFGASFLLPVFGNVTNPEFSK